MASESKKLVNDFQGFFKVYEDGSIERYWNTDYVPAGVDQEMGIESKDVEILAESGVKGRLFLPKLTSPKEKLPLVVHYHGGGFCIGSPFASSFKYFLSTIAAKTLCIVLSVDYRLAPEHKLPIAYDDCWGALQWVAKHCDGKGPEKWLNDHADLGRVVLAGESAGGTLANYAGIQAGVNNLSGVNIKRMMIVHPYFGFNEPDKYYQYICPTSSGFDDDPKINPEVDPNLKSLKCEKILICVAEKDKLKENAVRYFETMKSKWGGGEVELYETKGEDHCFHFFNPSSENLAPFMNKLFELITN